MEELTLTVAPTGTDASTDTSTDTPINALASPVAPPVVRQPGFNRNESDVSLLYRSNNTCRVYIDSSGMFRCYCFSDNCMLVETRIGTGATITNTQNGS
jgi:hypothetical protein